MNAINIKVGKTYKNGAGDIVKIETYDARHADYPFWGDNGSSYKADGRWVSGGDKLRDLVKEVGAGVQLEAGKRYRTRDGEQAFIIGRVPGGTLDKKESSDQPFAGFIGSVHSGIKWFKEDGSFWSKLGASEHDLVAEWAEPKRIKGWVNIYSGHMPDRWNRHNLKTDAYGGQIFHSRHDADVAALSGQTRIACIEIDVLEGQGLEGEAGR